MAPTKERPATKTIATNRKRATSISFWKRWRPALS